MEWQAVALLGAYHGINPGMGWLFAVALGMQRGSGCGVWRALPPLALGHAAAVGTVLLLAAAAGLVVAPGVVTGAVGATLVALGCYRLWRHRHPRFGGMQVGFRDLTIWSFLMASAHGAGLMIVPFAMPPERPASAHADPAAVHPGPVVSADALTGHAHQLQAASEETQSTQIAALAIHTGAYLFVAGLTAWVVYRKLGLALLRTAWLNLDWLWAGALVLTGVFVLLM
jgi:hypothetical protein